MKFYYTPQKTYLFACVASLVTLLGIAAEASGLELSLSTVDTNSIAFTNNNIELALTFTNSGPETVKLLKRFTPTPVFFEFLVVKDDGTPISVPGAGKISFSSPLQYVKLEKGKNHVVRINLEDVLKERLGVGEYNVSVLYKNQYGTDCFKGRINSNIISIKIVRNPNGKTGDQACGAPTK